MIFLLPVGEPEAAARTPGLRHRMGAGNSSAADTADVAVEIKDGRSVLMAPHAEIRFGKVAECGSFLELHDSFRPESGGRRHFQSVHFMRPETAIGNGGIGIVVDPHSIQPEKGKMFYLFGTLGIGIAVFYIGL